MQKGSIHKTKAAAAGAKFFLHAHELAEVVIDYWRKIGVETEQHLPVNSENYYSLRNASICDNLIDTTNVYNYSCYKETESWLYTMYHTNAYGKIFMGLPEEARINQLLDGIPTELDEAKRQEMMMEVIKIGAESYLTPAIAFGPVIYAGVPELEANMRKFDTYFGPSIRYWKWAE